MPWKSTNLDSFQSLTLAQYLLLEKNIFLLLLFFYSVFQLKMKYITLHLS